jgi:hypothetical protein
MREHRHVRGPHFNRVSVRSLRHEPLRRGRYRVIFGRDRVPRWLHAAQGGRAQRWRGFTPQFATAGSVRTAARPGPPPSTTQPDRVQVVLANLVGSLDQLLDVVVLGVEIAASKLVGAPGREDAHEARRKLRWGPGSVISER